PTKPFALTKPVQLVVYGTGANALKDSHGYPIDGGKNAIAILSGGGATIQAVPLAQVRSSGPAARLAAVDAVLERENLAVRLKSSPVLL
ncbi:MAG: hypothetical protein ACLQVF_41265, partial [Isosphaeraceae bacterium]